MANTNKLIFLNTSGLPQITPDGFMSNIGGTSNHTFTVGGRGLLFDDGSSTSGSGSLSSSLQAAYNASPIINNAAGIQLATGKDFAIFDDSNSNIFFKVDAETGKVTITGDLIVQGSSSIIESAITDSDHWRISPASGAMSALVIEPDVGVTPLVDVVVVKTSFNDPNPALRIDRYGDTYLKNLSINGNINIAGTVDGIDISALAAAFAAHTANSAAIQHRASQISVDETNLANIAPVPNAQLAIEKLNTKIDNLNVTGGNASGHVHYQYAMAPVWTITHNKATAHTLISVYDTSLSEVIPQTVHIVNLNTVRIYFPEPVSGKAVLTFTDESSVTTDGAEINPPPAPALPNPVFVNTVNGLSGDVVLTALVGATGAKGEDGAPGQPGIQGPKGEPGDSSINVFKYEIPETHDWQAQTAITISHNFGTRFNIVQAYDLNFQMIYPLF